MVKLSKKLKLLFALLFLSLTLTLYAQKVWVVCQRCGTDGSASFVCTNSGARGLGYAGCSIDENGNCKLTGLTEGCNADY
jgi:hypothetical protein